VNLRDLREAATFLRRLVVGQTEIDRLIRVIEAIEREIEKRSRNER
jgi:hypothetical protein